MRVKEKEKERGKRERERGKRERERGKRERREEREREREINTSAISLRPTKKLILSINGEDWSHYH